MSPRGFFAASAAAFALAALAAILLLRYAPEQASREGFTTAALLACAFAALAASAPKAGEACNRCGHRLDAALGFCAGCGDGHAGTPRARRTG